MVIKEDETLDTLFGGKLKIIQKKSGYRFSLDPILLTGFVDTSDGDAIVDLGTGCGIIPLIIALRENCERIVGVEIQGELAEMASRSVSLNGFSHRIQILKGDMRFLKGVLEEGKFDWVLSNPPYRKLRSGRISAADEKAIARHEIRGGLTDVIKAARFLLRPKGRLGLVYPAIRTVHLISELHHQGLEPKRIRAVYPYVNGSAKMLLVECVKEGGEELEFLPPLVVYNPDGHYTEEMKRVYGPVIP